MISLVVLIKCIGGSNGRRTKNFTYAVNICSIYITIFRLSLDLSQSTASRMNNELAHLELRMSIYLFISIIAIKNYKILKLRYILFRIHYVTISHFNTISSGHRQKKDRPGSVYFYSLKQEIIRKNKEEINNMTEKLVKNL